MNQPVIGITHPPDAVGTFFSDDDLERLQVRAEVVVLGSKNDVGFADRLAPVDVLLGAWGMPKLDDALLARAPRLRAVCYAAGSVKGFVTEASYARGVIVTTAMYANAVPVAEVTTALITLANKGWFPCQDAIRSRGREAYPDLHHQVHPGNYGTTVGLVGLGTIGRMVLERLHCMDLRALAYDPFVDGEAMRELGAEKVSLAELAQRSQVVSLHAPNIPECEHMIDAAFLAAMSDGAWLINTARGALVDEDALVSELESGRLNACLDVTQPEPPEAGHPFYRLANCWLTPHRAGSSAGEVRRMGRLAVDEAVRVLEGEEPLYRVRQEQLATMA